MSFLADWLQTRWYQPNPPWFLIPWAVLFGWIVALRRLAYRRGWKQASRLPVPVIVVGNLTVGGTGKTPLTIWLVETLKAAGYQPGVISRGYGGRKQPRPLLVYADVDPAEAGDEPVLIAQTTGCPVAVFPKRAEAGRALLERHGCDVLIADDGLQHYALARDLEIAVVDGERRFGNGALLPAGPLREPVSRLQRADFIVSRGVAQTGEYAMNLACKVAVNLADATQRKSLPEFKGEKLEAIAGIGHPQRFFTELKGLGLDIKPHAFPDHHGYSPADLAQFGEATVLMTEKDAVKCRRFVQAQHWAVPLQAQLPLEFAEAVLQQLKKVKP